MNKTYLNKSILVFFVCLLFSLLVLAGCENSKPTPSTNPVTPTLPPVVTEPTEPTEPIESTEPEEWTGITAKSFVSYTTDYTGTVGEQEITGVLFQSDTANSKTTLTKDAVIALRKYARANGYDGLRVYVYPAQEEGNFVIGGQTAKCGQWNKLDISLANLDSLTAFSSQAKTYTETYMVFEFIKLPAINATSFIKDVYAFSGTIGGRTFDGFVYKSMDYQPTTYFHDFAVEDIKAYAEENGFNALRVHCYPIQKDNSFLVGGNPFHLNKWETIDFSVKHLTTEFAFWSQSQGVTENYMYFEFVNSSNPVIPSGRTGPKKPSSPYFTSTMGYSVEKYSGTVADVEFEGFKFTSSVYQPDFYFTQKAIEEILDAAEKSGNNFLRIHSYAILLDNGFVVGNQHTRAGQWGVTDVNIADLSTAFRFWSQSQGTTEVYLWFEMYQLDIPERTSDINASYFQRSHKKDGSEYIVSFYNYAGEAGDTVINGIQIKSGDYQPYFKFSAEGLEKIKAYAKENDVNFLKIHSYAILFDNGFVVGNQHTRAGQWNEVDIAVDSLNEEYTFWSQSQGATEIYMWFEFYKLDVPDATSDITAEYFERGKKKDGSDYILTFSDYMGNAGDTTINGVRIQSGDYQPRFKFTADGVEKIKAYAEANDVNFLKIHSYAILFDNGFTLGGQHTRANEWCETNIAVAALSEEYEFWSESQGKTDIYLWFEFYKLDIPEITTDITAGYFERGKKNDGSEYNMTFHDYVGSVGDATIYGVKIVSSDYQPKFKFTEKGITAIKAYAEKNDVNNLVIHSYAILTDNGFRVNGVHTRAGEWAVTEVKVDKLSEEFVFASESQSLTEIYLWFELNKSNLIDFNSFAGDAFTFERHQGIVGEVEFSGIRVTGTSENSSFTFTNDAIQDIKKYAAEDFSNTLQIDVYPAADRGSFKMGDAVCEANQWTSVKVDVNALDESFVFAFEGNSNVEVYLKFTFIADKIISASSFTGTFTAEEFAGMVGGEEIVGLKLISAGRKRDNFNTDAIAQIQAYAAAKGYTELKIRVYVTIDNNVFTAFGQSVTKDQWNELTVSVDSLTTSLRIQTTCTGNTEAYFVFEFQ